MKNALLALLTAALLAAVAIAVKQRNELAELRAAAAAPAAPRPSERVRPAPEKPARPAEPVQVVHADPPSAPAARPAAPIPETPPPARDKKPAANFMAGLSSMMTNAAMKEMIRSQTKMQLGLRYDRLIKYFNLSPEEAEQFKALLMDRQMALMDVGFGMMKEGQSEADRTAQAEKMKQTMAGFDQQLKDLLGAEDYEALQQYEATEPERMQVEMFKHSLADEPLTEQQEYDLVNAMYAARTNSSSALLKQRPDTPPDPKMFNAEGMKKMMEDMAQVETRYTETAKTILSPAQFASFEKHLEQQRAMQEMGMKMAAQMFGEGGEGTPAAVEVQVQPAP